MCDPRITSALNLVREANPLPPSFSLVANDDALETSSVTSPRGSKRFGNERREGEKERENSRCKPTGRIIFMGNLRQAAQSLIPVKFAPHGMARINGSHHWWEERRDRNRRAERSSSNRASRRAYTDIRMRHGGHLVFFIAAINATWLAVLGFSLIPSDSCRGRSWRFEN